MENALQPLIERIDLLLSEKERILIAIDGNCTAGKTTLAGQLASLFDCNVFHMDDFFLRPEQRNEERYAQAGGNVDYERFFAEVLLPLRAGTPFSYRPFDCKTFSFSQAVPVSAKRVNIIEGSYSLHPFFGDPYDLKILLTVSQELQHQRVLKRPAHLHHRFFEMWIPMENRYLERFQISDKADFIISAPIFSFFP